MILALVALGCNEARVHSLGRSVDPGIAGNGTTAGSGGAGGLSGGSAGSGGAGAPGGSGGSMSRLVFSVLDGRHQGLCEEGDNDNPTLTADLLEIYFSTDRDESDSEEDIWYARRSSVNEEFTNPMPVDSVNTDGRENSPAVSPDGTRLWLSSDRPGGLGEQDIWVSTRVGATGPWSEPVPVGELNSTADDIPRPPGQGGLVMPLGSRRDDDQNYYTYLAGRTTTSAPFSDPVLASELVTEGHDTIDAFLSEDGLTIFYNLATDEYNGNLFMSVRAFTSAPFSRPMPLGVNTPGDERDPWMSPDGQTFFFSRDPDGEDDAPRCIVEARVTREP